MIRVVCTVAFSRGVRRSGRFLVVAFLHGKLVLVQFTDAGATCSREVPSCLDNRAYALAMAPFYACFLAPIASLLLV